MAKGEAFDKIKCVQLSASVRQFRQVPSWRRWRAADTSDADYTVSGQDPGNRAHARHNTTASDHGAMNRFGTAFSQGGVAMQPTPQLENRALNRRGGASWTRIATRTAGPINPEQALFRGASYPKSHRTLRLTKPPRRRTNTQPSSNASHPRTSCLLAVFFTMLDTLRVSRTTDRARRSSSLRSPPQHALSVVVIKGAPTHVRNGCCHLKCARVAVIYPLTASATAPMGTSGQRRLAPL